MRTYYALIFLAILVGCSPKPMFSNLHKGTYGYHTAPKEILQVSVGLLPITKIEPEKDKPRMAWDLRDSIPHTLIRTLATKDSANAFMKMMAVEIPALEKKESTALATDYTQHKVMLTFSTIKRYFVDQRFIHPNTRLEFLNIVLKFSDTSNFSFYNIDKLTNEFEEIDLGMLERNASMTFNAKLSGQGDLGYSMETNTSDAFENGRVKKKD